MQNKNNEDKLLTLIISTVDMIIFRIVRKNVSSKSKIRKAVVSPVEFSPTGDPAESFCITTTASLLFKE